jgi:hypothetical protein
MQTKKRYITIILLLSIMLTGCESKRSKEINALNDDLTHFVEEAVVIHGKLRGVYRTSEGIKRLRTDEETRILSELPSLARSIHCETERVREVRDEYVRYLKSHLDDDEGETTTYDGSEMPIRVHSPGLSEYFNIWIDIETATIKEVKLKNLKVSKDPGIWDF